ncbi:MAG: hypothetical protein J5680_00310 [Neisseriaceae bacterium]|nr:hypothetical protein [Neisseriaceae bacterium]
MNFIVGSYQNHTSLLRLAVLSILSSARCLVCFWSEPTISAHLSAHFDYLSAHLSVHFIGSL